MSPTTHLWSILLGEVGELVAIHVSPSGLFVTMVDFTTMIISYLQSVGREVRG